MSKSVAELMPAKGKRLRAVPSHGSRSSIPNRSLGRAEVFSSLSSVFCRAGKWTSEENMPLGMVPGVSFDLGMGRPWIPEDCECGRHLRAGLQGISHQREPGAQLRLPHVDSSPSVKLERNQTSIRKRLHPTALPSTGYALLVHRTVQSDCGGYRQSKQHQRSSGPLKSICRWDCHCICSLDHVR